MAKTVIAENIVRSGSSFKYYYKYSKQMDESKRSNLTASMKDMLGDKKAVTVRVAAC